MKVSINGLKDADDVEDTPSDVELYLLTMTKRKKLKILYKPASIV